MQAQPLDELTLARGVGVARARHLRQLADNGSIAGLLARYASELGDWRALFAEDGAFNKVTASQVQLAAVRYLIPSRQTTVRMLPPAPAPAEATRGAGQ